MQYIQLKLFLAAMASILTFPLKCKGQIITLTTHKLGGRFPFYLTLTNIWKNTKGKYSPGIYPGIPPVICLLRDPWELTFNLNLL